MSAIQMSHALKLNFLSLAALSSAFSESMKPLVTVIKMHTLDTEVMASAVVNAMRIDQVERTTEIHTAEVASAHRTSGIMAINAEAGSTTKPSDAQVEEISRLMRTSAVIPDAKVISSIVINEVIDESQGSGQMAEAFRTANFPKGNAQRGNQARGNAPRGNQPRGNG